MNRFFNKKIAQVIFLGSTLLLVGTPACPQPVDETTQQEELQQQVSKFLSAVKKNTRKAKDFFVMLKEGEQKRRELTELNQENVRESQKKAREAMEANRRLQEETRAKLEDARMRQKEQLRMMQDRMRR